MDICYLCEKELVGDDLSSEHIIPQSLGGRLTSTKLLCKTCNRKTGELYDSQFSDFGDFFCNYYNVERSRSKHKKVVCIEDKTGHKYFLTPGEKTFNLTLADVIVEESENFVSSRTSDPKRAEHEMKRLKKKFPDYEFSLKAIEHNGNSSDVSGTGTVPLDYDRNLLLKSVCKTMASFFLLKGGEKRDIIKLIDFIKLSSESINHFCVESQFSLDRQELPEGPYHILVIKCDNMLRCIYGYFEIFGCIGYFTLLSGVGDYKGPDKILAYAYDLINRQAVAFKPDFRLASEELLSIIEAIHEEPETIIGQIDDLKR